MAEPADGRARTVAEKIKELRERRARYELGLSLIHI